MENSRTKKKKLRWGKINKSRHERRREKKPTPLIVQHQMSEDNYKNIKKIIKNLTAIQNNDFYYYFAENINKLLNL